MITINKQVACLPFSDNKKEQVRGALALIDRKITLVELTVLATFKDKEYGCLEPGNVILVRSDRATQPWAKERLTCDQIVKETQKVEFILVPLSEIVGVKAQ